MKALLLAGYSDDSTHLVVVPTAAVIVPMMTTAATTTQMQTLGRLELAGTAQTMAWELPQSLLTTTTTTTTLAVLSTTPASKREALVHDRLPVPAPAPALPLCRWGYHCDPRLHCSPLEHRLTDAKVVGTVTPPHLGTMTVVVWTPKQGRQQEWQHVPRYWRVQEQRLAHSQR